MPSARSHADACIYWLELPHKCVLPCHNICSASLLLFLTQPTTGSHRLPDQARQVSPGTGHIQVAPAAEEL